jgi:hypothetical protein
MMQVEEYSEEDSLGGFLFDAGVPEEQVRKWEHAERMMLLGDGLGDYYEEIQARCGGNAPDDVQVMMQRGESQATAFRDAMDYLRAVAEGEEDPDDPEVEDVVARGMEGARSSYAWRATAIEAWTARLRARI